MKEIKKILYMDRFFLLILMIILGIGSFIVNRWTIVVFQCQARVETENREDVAQWGELYGVTSTYDEVYRFGGYKGNCAYYKDHYDERPLYEINGVPRCYYQNLAVWTGAMLLLGFWLKWLIGENGRKVEFHDGLPVREVSYKVAELMELLLLSGITLIVNCIYMVMIHKRLLRKYPKSVEILKETFALSDHGRMTLITFVFIIFTVSLLMFLKGIVRKIFFLPFVWSMLFGLFPLLSYACMELADSGFPMGKSTLDQVTDFDFAFGDGISRISILGTVIPRGNFDGNFYDTELYPWNLFLLYKGKDEISMTMTIILIMATILCIAGIILLSGKKDSSGRKLVVYFPAEIIGLLVLMVESLGVALTTFTGVMKQTGAGIGLSVILSLVITVFVWYLLDGKYRCRTKES